MRRVEFALLSVILLTSVPGVSLHADDSAPPACEARLRFPSIYPEQRLEFEPGMTLTYLDHGQGFPVAFLHGLGADHHQWNENMPAVADRFRVLAIDFPGHGKSDRVQGYEYGIPKYSKALIALFDARGIEKAVLVGNSMGGQVAIYTALHHPDRVARLILVDAAGAGDFGMLKEGLCSAAMQLDMTRVVTPGLAEVLDGFVVSRNQGGAITCEMRSKLCEDVSSRETRRMMTEVMGGSLESIFEHDMSANLHRISQKTLIVWGTNDKLIPVTHALRLHYRLPDSKLVLYAGVGHVPSVEVPDRFNRAMDRFLRDLADDPIRVAGR